MSLKGNGAWDEVVGLHSHQFLKTMTSRMKTKMAALVCVV